MRFSFWCGSHLTITSTSQTLLPIPDHIDDLLLYWCRHHAEAAHDYKWR